MPRNEVASTPYLAARSGHAVNHVSGFRATKLELAFAGALR
jgi:hypothetical protein